MSKTQRPQQITPQLRQWIVDQAKAGCTPESVLDSMCAAGWDEEVALAALEQTLKGHLAQVAVAPDRACAAAIPEPDLSDSPISLDLGDRQVSVLMTLVRPRVVLLGGFLSDAECEELIREAAPRMRRSTTVAGDTGGEAVHESRTSNGMFFQRGENAIVRCIEERIARLVRWPLENGEGMQVLQYRSGAEYLPHYDYFDPGEPGTASIVSRGGQRVATVVMYLNDPQKGGATIFPDVQLSIAPQRGNAVFFSYAAPHPSTGSLHGGAPVIAGEKWIATKWLRESEF